MSYQMYKKYQEAILFVCDRYKEVKDEDKCELFHTLDVGYELIRFGYSGDIVVSGFLHDIFEETDTQKEEVKKLFGDHVLEYISLMTKDDSMNDWYKKNEDIIDRCREHSHEALALKAADVLVNARYFSNSKDEENVEKDRFMAKTIFKKDVPIGDLFTTLRQYT